jgi:hypothetical protein
MHPQVKKYVSFFFLLLFLFPIVEKGMHELEHKADLHCSAADKHFHPLVHSCAICQFTVIDLTDIPSAVFYFRIYTQPFLFQTAVERIDTIPAFQYIPARAPPVA